MAGEIAAIDTSVSTNIQKVDDIRNELMAQATTFLDELKESCNLDVPYIEPTPLNIENTSIWVSGIGPTKIDVGSEINNAMVGIVAPGDVSLTDLQGDIDRLDGITIPDFNVSAPVLNMPDIPDPDFPTAPAEPTIADITRPTRPNYTLPAEPTIRDISIPAAPTFVMPEYVPEFPLDDLIPPVNTFSVTEQEYLSDLLDAVKANLKDKVLNGGTGLGVDVSRSIWELKQEQNEKALQEAIDALVADFSGRAYDLPTGALQASIRKLRSDYADKRIDSSREVTIEEARMALQNTQFAIQNGIAVEGLLLQHHNQVAERAINVAKASADVGIAIFNANVVYYNAKWQAAQVRAQIYEAQIRTILAQSEIYRTQMEGTKLEATVQAQYVEIYKAQLEAVNIIQNLYKTDMEAANIEANIEKSKVDIFRARIDAYSARIAGETARYGALRAKIEGETAKVQAFEAQARAYGIQIDGQKVKADVASTILKAKVQSDELKIEEMRSNIEKWKIAADLALKRVGALTDMYRADSDVYRTDIGLSEAMARLEVERLRARLEASMANVKNELETGKANLEAYTQASNIKTRAAEGGAKIYADMIGAIFNSLSTVVQAYSGGVTTKTEE